MPEKPCPECGCVPSSLWRCECTNEDCPCSEPDEPDEGEMFFYSPPQGDQAQRDLGYRPHSTDHAPTTCRARKSPVTGISRPQVMTRSEASSPACAPQSGDGSQSQMG